jgi:hypothetical protein
VFHLESGSWVDRTAPGSTYAALCTTGVSSLSPFAIGALAPTAAGISISGRVITASGQGITNSVLTLSDSSGHVRTARTAGFGYYRFDDVQAGETYVLSVSSKRFAFQDPTRIISVQDDISDADFVAIDPGKGSR